MPQVKITRYKQTFLILLLIGTAVASLLALRAKSSKKSPPPKLPVVNQEKEQVFYPHILPAGPVLIHPNFSPGKKGNKFFSSRILNRLKADFIAGVEVGPDGLVRIPSDDAENYRAFSLILKTGELIPLRPSSRTQPLLVDSGCDQEREIPTHFLEVDSQYINDHESWIVAWKTEPGSLKVNVWQGDPVRDTTPCIKKVPEAKKEVVSGVSFKNGPLAGKKIFSQALEFSIDQGYGYVTAENIWLETSSGDCVPIASHGFPMVDQGDIVVRLSEMGQLVELTSEGEREIWLYLGGLGWESYEATAVQVDETGRVLNQNIFFDGENGACH